MSLSLKIKVGQLSQEFALNVAEIAMFHGLAAANKEVDHATEMLFSPEHRPRQISAGDLLRFVDLLLQSIKAGVGEKIYSVCIAAPEDQMMQGWGRGISGLRINGELFSIRAGPGRCVLRKIRIKEDGRGEFVEERDVRGMKEIRTENRGVIRIRERSKPTQIQRLLRQLKELLKRIPTDTIVSVDVG